jgi:hypothetical protein
MFSHASVLADTLLAAESPATVEPVNPPASGIAIALIISVVLITLVLLFGRRSTWASVAIAFIGFIGIAGVLALTAPIAALQSALVKGLSGGVESAGGDNSAYLLIIVILAAVGVFLFVRGRTLGSFAALVLLSLPLLANQTFQGWSRWYIENVGVNIWNFLAGFINSL